MSCITLKSPVQYCTVDIHEVLGLESIDLQDHLNSAHKTFGMCHRVYAV